MLVAGNADRVAELRGFPLKRAFAYHVDRAGHRVGGRRGGGRFRDLQAREVVHGDLRELEHARATLGIAGVGHLHAVARDDGHARGKTAHGDRGDGAAGLGVVFRGDAGEKLEELADVAVGDFAERIGRDHIF